MPKGKAAVLVLCLLSVFLAEAKIASFIGRSGKDFTLDGKPYRFTGANTYYLMYKAKNMSEELFSVAANNSFQVLRTWTYIDIGNQDGSNSVDGSGKKDGVYFHYWNGNSPAFNDGADGIQYLDSVIYSAGQHGVRLLLSLTNNWRDFGGMDQYVKWKNAQYHDSFYSDATILGWFKDWISHLLNHVNPLTNLAYKDDPIIFGWELANEPRCQGSGNYPPSQNCQYQKGADILTSWVTEISAHIKSVDSKHLVGVGDEGFPCFAGPDVGWDWALDCYPGVDTVRFAQVPTIDFMTVHLYPSQWGKQPAWGVDWIKNHTTWAHEKAIKPVILEEYGIQDKGQRDSVYSSWTDAVYSTGMNGDLFWMLATSDYADYDGYTVYCPSSTCTLFANHAKKMLG